jgi:hypothetical protein
VIEFGSGSWKTETLTEKSADTITFASEIAARPVILFCSETLQSRLNGRILSDRPNDVNESRDEGILLRISVPSNANPPRCRLEVKFMKTQSRHSQADGGAWNQGNTEPRAHQIEDRKSLTCLLHDIWRESGVAAQV